MSVYSIDGDTNSSNWSTADAPSEFSGGGLNGAAVGLGLSKMFKSFGQAQQYQGQAVALDADADLLGLQAEQILVTSDYVTKRMEEKGKKVSGAQMMAYAKSGVTFEGSPMLVYAETEKNIRLDILTTRLNYVAEANRLGFKALNERIQAGWARTKAVQKYGEGVLSMVTTMGTAG